MRKCEREGREIERCDTQMFEREARERGGNEQGFRDF